MSAVKSSRDSQLVKYEMGDFTDECNKILIAFDTIQEKQKNKDFVTYKEAFRKLVLNSTPRIIGAYPLMLVQVINLIFVGHLNNPAELAGVGLANLLINIICFSVASGMNEALDSLASQAFKEKQHYLGGCLLNRMRIIQFLLFLIDAIVLLFTKEILMVLGQDEAAAEAAQIYTFTILPALFALTQFETLRRYLQAMKISNVSIQIVSVSMLFHILWCYLFVIHLEFGIVGVSISTGITSWLNLVIITLLISLKPNLVKPLSWHFFNKDSFKELEKYMKYGVPSTLIICSEWWILEVMVLFSGMLSVNELAANIILINFLYIVFQLAYGISSATCTLVVNNLRKEKPVKALRYTITSLVAVVCLTGVINTLTIILRYLIAYIYTQQEEVVEIVEEILPLFAVILFFDNFQGVAKGSIKALGYQRYGNVAAMISFWIFSIPCAYFFAFHLNLRLQGIWLGYSIGGLSAAIGYSVIFVKLDWNRVVLESNEQLQNNKTELSNLPLIS